MNRTATRAGYLPASLWLLASALAAQTPSGESPGTPQDPVIKELVEKMRAAERGVTRIRMQLATEGRMPGDLEFRTKGRLRVLRTEQGAASAVHSDLEFTFADGVSGRMQSVWKPDGVQILEDNPLFGESFLQIDAEVLRDLEWAGEVLRRSDLPGAPDQRAVSPLGSSMVADLAQRYELAKLSHKWKDGSEGHWYGGDRRTGPGEAEDPDLPLADRVELFVRDDLALQEVVFLQMGKVVQRITVEELVLGEPMAPESFRIDAKGMRPQDVRQHTATWEQIQHVLESAARTSGQEPPSRRTGEAGEPGGEPKGGSGGTGRDR